MLRLYVQMGKIPTLDLDAHSPCIRDLPHDLSRCFVPMFEVLCQLTRLQSLIRCSRCDSVWDLGTLSLNELAL